MIEFVYGAKGSGKTKKMIDMANAEVGSAKGDILFINDRDKYRVTVDTKIRDVYKRQVQYSALRHHPVHHQP